MQYGHSEQEVVHILEEQSRQHEISYVPQEGIQCKMYE